LKTEQDDDNITEGEILKGDLAKIPDFIGRSLDDVKSGFTVKEWELKVKKDRTIIKVELVDSTNRDIEYKYDFITADLVEKDM